MYGIWSNDNSLTLLRIVNLFLGIRIYSWSNKHTLAIYINTLLIIT